MDSRGSPYNNYQSSPLRPLPFPEASREVGREGGGAPYSSGVTIPMGHYPATRVSPLEKSPVDTPDGRGSMKIVIPHGQVPIASPEDEGDHHVIITQSKEDPEFRGVRPGSVVLPEEDTQTRHFISWRTVIELLSILAAMIPMVVAPHLGAYERGLYCNDPDIRYPFREGTVKPWLLYLICLLLPFVVVVIGEMCHFYVSKTGYAQMEVKYRLWRKGPRVPPVLISITRIIVLFAYGFLITKSVTDICKYAVGRLRPHFWDVCNPDLDLIRQDLGGASCENHYIINPHCRNALSTDHKVQYRIRDMRLSFLSGHAAMAFFSMFFLIFYLESRLRWMNLRYCKAIMQFGLFLMAALCGMSRISDHKHHWTDVFAGTLLGLVVCVITVFFVGGYFNDSHYLRYKVVNMLNKIDWGHREGAQYAGLLSETNGMDPRALRQMKHFTRHDFPKPTKIA
ncbi:phospholipid phosphatase 1-like isoform X2 [Paramacrobiotus metropolitanus]|uniref:phospholipid phosphatase 1-like isoform X2 n=2 Tax=Paramacrobiotus metropolitanus TaxID=2943436 RepID=UPI0024458271|nr:phospholipid phosphatase 1-like isoform X2 [Paramacrobiotus metropolitanus]